MSTSALSSSLPPTTSGWSVLTRLRRAWTSCAGGGGWWSTRGWPTSGSRRGRGCGRGTGEILVPLHGEQMAGLGEAAELAQTSVFEPELAAEIVRDRLGDED